MQPLAKADPNVGPDYAQIVRRIYDGYAEGNFDSSREWLDPHVVLVLDPGFGPEVSGERTWVGVDALAAYTRDLIGAWEGFRMEAQEIAPAGDSVLVTVRQHGRGQVSGAPTDLSYFTLWSFRGDRVIRIESFRERGPALEAAGLQEASGDGSNSHPWDFMWPFYEQWSRGDFSSAEWAHPDIEFIVRDGPTVGTYRGRESAGRAWGEVVSAWEDLRTVVEGSVPIDDETILVLTQNSGRGKLSGLELGEMQTRGANLLTVRDGFVVRMDVYWNRDHAYADLDLDMDENPIEGRSET